MQEEEGSQKDVLVDTEVRTDFPRWTCLLQGSREKAQPELAPRSDPTKGCHLVYQRHRDSLDSSLGANLTSHGHMFISIVIDAYHPLCL